MTPKLVFFPLQDAFSVISCMTRDYGLSFVTSQPIVHFLDVLPYFGRKLFLFLADFLMIPFKSL